MKIIALYEGSYSVDISKRFIPFDPAIHQASDRPASLFIHVQPFLIKTVDDLIVIDTGLGYKNESGELMIHQHIRNAGFEPYEVSLVLMSHLHADHAKGMVVEKDGEIEAAFPNASYVIQKGEWKAALSSTSSSYDAAGLAMLEEHGRIHIVEGSGRLNSSITYELTGGHCAFHQVFLVQEGTEIAFFGGDILPEPEQLLRKFIAKYDFDGRKAMELRQAYGERAAAEHWTCLFYHAKSHAIAKVNFDGLHFSIHSA